MNLRQWILDLRLHMIDGNGNLDARSRMTSGKLMIIVFVYFGWLERVAERGLHQDFDLCSRSCDDL